MKHIVILTGAGISAESGIKTFRDSGGLWEGHDVMEVASPQGWHDNPETVLRFYNERRKQLLTVKPNFGHRGLALLEDKYRVTVITQNVDDLHERAGSTNVHHIHGELFKVRCTCDSSYEIEWKKDLTLNDKSPNGCQLRPAIVWFGEPVPKLSEAALISQTADIFIIIGTSLNVYPAASLIGYVAKGIPIYLVDPMPQLNYELKNATNVTVIEDVASNGVKTLLELLM